jgi:hypothetical protein
MAPLRAPAPSAASSRLARPSARRVAPPAAPPSQHAAAAAAVAATLVRGSAGLMPLERRRRPQREEEEEEERQAAAAADDPDAAAAARLESLLLMVPPAEEQQPQSPRRKRRAQPHPPELSPADAADRARAAALRAAPSLAALAAEAAEASNTLLGPRASTALATRAAALVRRVPSGSRQADAAEQALSIVTTAAGGGGGNQAPALLLDPIGAALVLQSLGALADALGDGPLPEATAQSTAAAARVACRAVFAPAPARRREGSGDNAPAAVTGPAQLAQASWGAAKLLSSSASSQLEEARPALERVVCKAAGLWTQQQQPSARDCAQMAGALAMMPPSPSSSTLGACARLLCAQMTETLSSSQEAHRLGLAEMAALASAAAGMLLAPVPFAPPPSLLPPLLAALLARSQVELSRLAAARGSVPRPASITRLGALAHSLASLLRAQRRAACRGPGAPLGAAPAAVPRGFGRTFSAALAASGAMVGRQHDVDDADERLLALASAAGLLSELKRHHCGGGGGGSSEDNADADDNNATLLLSACTRLLPRASDARPVLLLAAHAPRVLPSNRAAAALIAALSDAAERTGAAAEGPGGAAVLAGAYGAWRVPPASETLRRQLTRAVLSSTQGVGAGGRDAAKAAWALARAGVLPASAARHRFAARFVLGEGEEDNNPPLIERMDVEALSWAVGAAAAWMMTTTAADSEDEHDQQQQVVAAASRRLAACLALERRRRRRVPTAVLARLATALARLEGGGGRSNSIPAAAARPPSLLSPLFAAACEDSFLRRSRGPPPSPVSTLHLSAVLLASSSAAGLPSDARARLSRELARQLARHRCGGGGSDDQQQQQQQYASRAALRAVMMLYSSQAGERTQEDSDLLLRAALPYASLWPPRARACAVEAAGVNNGAALLAVADAAAPAAASVYPAPPRVLDASVSAR